MITKFKIFEKKYFDYDNIINKIKSVLTPDLLKGIWAKEQDNPVAGHCYVATESLYWILGGPNGEWKPYVLTHKKWPEGLDKGETHWFLKDKNGNILDPTKEQFDIDIDYNKGIANGMMDNPKGGSKRAKEVIRRIENLKENNTPLIINDKYYKICIENAMKSKSDSERYGAIVVKNNRIIGQGYNRAIAHSSFKLDRILKQGYANHAEVEAMNDALSNDYDIDNSDIYVAGYFPKTGILFFKSQFTCKLCISFFEKYNIKNIFVPLPDKWNKKNIEECKKDSLLFNRVNIHNDRLKYLIGNYNISLLQKTDKKY